MSRQRLQTKLTITSTHVGVVLAVCILVLIRLHLMVTLPPEGTKFHADDRTRLTSSESSLFATGATTAVTDLVTNKHRNEEQRYKIQIIESSARANVTTGLEVPESEWQNKHSPMKDLLKVYVYDSLDPNFTTTVEKIYTQRVLDNPTQDYNTRGELVLFKLFRTFPGRTYDPEKADIFVVPYPHYYHCLHTMGYSFQCGRQKYRPQLERLWSTLTFYDIHNSNGGIGKKAVGGQRRHLFIAGVDNGLVHKRLALVPLHVSIGPIFKKLSQAQHHRSQPHLHPLIQNDIDLLEIKGDIVVPYVNDHPMYQPSMLHSNSRNSYWILRNRTYSLVYFYGTNNRKMMDNGGGRRFREYFAKEISSVYGDEDSSRAEKYNRRSLGGKPFLIRPISYNSNEPVSTYFRIYKDSIFCLCLPGDGPAQKRFFDVLLSGCLPVVLEWPIYNRTDVSWFMPDNIHTGTHKNGDRYLKYILTAPSWASYPYWNTTIDYKSFVVRVPSNPYNMSDMSHVMPYLEDLLRNWPNEIRHRQIALQHYAPLLTWGMGSDAHLNEDGFTELLKSLKDYILLLQRIEQKEKEQWKQRQRVQHFYCMVLFFVSSVFIANASLFRLHFCWKNAAERHL